MALAFLKINMMTYLSLFFTLDASRNKLKGESGLGLTISRDIIRSHGGDISLLKSSLGGVKVSVALPK